MSEASNTVHVPIFPLDTVILVPGGILPLHVFEPRYRTMVADAMAGERLIAMALPLPGHSVDEEERPPVHAVCGMGRVVHHDPLPDGRSHVVLHGESRVRILEELSAGTPYRMVRAEVLEDVVSDAPTLAARTRGLLARFPDLGEEDRARLATLEAGPLIDALIGMLAAPIQDRQRIHANPDVAWRIREVGVLLDILQGSRYRTELPPDDPRMN